MFKHQFRSRQLCLKQLIEQIKNSHQFLTGPLSRRLCPSISRTINSRRKKSGSYEDIALTSHFGFRDLVTYKASDCRTSPSDLCHAHDVLK